MIEFTLTFLPLMALLILVVDTSWAVFAQGVLQQAVRFGVRSGVTLTSTQLGDGDLTSAVKGIVQSHAVGLLKGDSGYAKIKVHYFLGQDPSQDVSGEDGGDNPGNIMQVSVENFPLAPMVARIYDWKHAPDKNPMSISVYAADIIEPNNATPPIGVAP